MPPHGLQGRTVVPVFRLVRLKDNRLIVVRKCVFRRPCIKPCDGLVTSTLRNLLLADRRLSNDLLAWNPRRPSISGVIGKQLPEFFQLI
jgi:hypothetical protein